MTTSTERNGDDAAGTRRTAANGVVRELVTVSPAWLAPELASDSLEGTRQPGEKVRRVHVHVYLSIQRRPRRLAVR